MTSRNQAVALIGRGSYSAFASDVPALIAGLTAGRHVPSRPWFSCERDRSMMNMFVNPQHAPLPVQKTRRALTLKETLRLITGVIDEALRESGQPHSLLSGERVRVYIAGNGLRTDIAEVAGYRDRNDPEDLLYFPAIKKLHANCYAQDALSEALAAHYGLTRPPATLYSASASSMSAVHLAHAALRSGLADVALVVSWVDILTQDMMFLAAQNMLGESPACPFNGRESSVLFSNGAAALLMCRDDLARRRGLSPAVYLDSCVSYQHSGARDNASTGDFRTITHSIEQAMKEADVAAGSIGCIFPHGNGIPASDNTEAMAIRKLWGDEGIPVVSYKGQTGYLSTCSALVDLIIACDALKTQRLLSWHSPVKTTTSSHLHLHCNTAPVTLTARHLVKTALGMEGSIVSSVLSRREVQP
ncbi:beta-ketoacyl synthase N-terminal-like domain-containing protein [Erwinia oleae]|uniref:beta-ketoacyl synthase N-terminal-like domain-containing protein n=1 Tax=Erwinia oleae TaxID=796334 RepID=UPI00055710B1|nr:beta-ketoacyl synthase N-terminal-like domain-containing protein [Erwinia oleae]